MSSAWGTDIMKDIAFHISPRASQDASIDYAVSVAGAFDAHLTGVAFALQPSLPATMGLADARQAEWVDEEWAKAEAAAKAAIARFEGVARRNGVEFGSRILETNMPGAGDLFGEIAKGCDLSIVRQAEPEPPPLAELVSEGARFGSGRPVLVVPYIQRSPLTLDRVLVCWNGSRNAARAIGDAMPFLRRARTVEVLIALGEAGRKDVIEGADIAGHLARHGLRIEVEHLAAIKGDVASTILSHAADVGADFIVMGGYGHSRLREFILGGVTRDILRSMTVPALMAH